MRSPRFVYIPCISIPSLLTPAIPHTLDCLTSLSLLMPLDMQFQISPNPGDSSVAFSFNEACVFTHMHYGLLTRYRELQHKTSRLMSSHGTFLFLSLPPEQSIDGLEFHQLIYKRLLAYRISRITIFIYYRS